MLQIISDSGQLTQSFFTFKINQQGLLHSHSIHCTVCVQSFNLCTILENQFLCLPHSRHTNILAHTHTHTHTHNIRARAHTHTRTHTGHLDANRPVPFRLTPALQTLLTKLGMTGPLQMSMLATARCLVQPNVSLESILRAVLRDEFISWMKVCNTLASTPGRFFANRTPGEK